MFSLKLVCGCLCIGTSAVHRPACVLVACVYVWFILMFAALMVVHTRQARPTQVLPRPRSLSSQVEQYLGCAERRPVSEARRSDEGADRFDWIRMTIPQSHHERGSCSSSWMHAVVHEGIADAMLPPERNLIICHHPLSFRGKIVQHILSMARRY